MVGTFVVAPALVEFLVPGCMWFPFSGDCFCLELDIKSLRPYQNIK